ncbi:MAG TPA: hypothetical protein VOA41_06830 [Candidatus Dormibacteraeota bacterium]|nr:hypothetical protein [Candidatus Dormibacteraeota bacterium]
MSPSFNPYHTLGRVHIWRVNVNARFTGVQYFYFSRAVVGG